MRSRLTSASYFRNFVFGVEDSLVSTVGLLSGIAIADVPEHTVFLTGVILILVEAFSMAVGSFLSEHSADDYVQRRESSSRRSSVASVIMFFSYFVSGFIPLFPYFFFPTGTAIALSITLSLGALFLLGVIGARISRISILRNGLRMLMIGGIAIAAGIAVGKFVHIGP